MVTRNNIRFPRNITKKLSGSFRSYSPYNQVFNSAISLPKQAAPCIDIVCVLLLRCWGRRARETSPWRRWSLYKSSGRTTLEKILESDVKCTRVWYARASCATRAPRGLRTSTKLGWPTEPTADVQVLVVILLYYMSMSIAWNMFTLLGEPGGK